MSALVQRPLIRTVATAIRWLVRLLALLATLLLAGQRAIACSPIDPGACIDGAQYNFWAGVAQTLWSLDRSLLQLTYSIHQFRWWVVEVAYGFMYEVLAQGLGPLLPQVAIIAVTLAILLFLLLPFLGRTRIVDLRHALVWTVLAPAVLAVVGPQLTTIEQARSDFSGIIIAQGAEAITSVPLFGAAASDMTAPKALYPANPCGNGELTRRDGGLRPDDLTAALAGATAQDIHCPDKEGPSSTLPDAFFEQGSPVEFATTLDVGNDLQANDRKRAIERIQAGVTRLALMILPALLAVLDALVQLIFALCLVTLWLGLPVGLVVVYFHQTSHAVTGLFRQTIKVIQVSWTCSALLGIVLICLRATAELTNASAYAGFAVGALLLTAYFLVVAFQTLGSCVLTLNDTVLTATGLSVTQPAQLAGSAATTGAALAGAALGGAAGMGLTYALAQRQTGSRGLALAAAGGRWEPLMEVGQVANAMGWVSDDVADALYAGQRSTDDLYRSHKLLHGIGQRRRVAAASTAPPSFDVTPAPPPPAPPPPTPTEVLPADNSPAADVPSAPPLTVDVTPQATGVTPSDVLPPADAWSASVRARQARLREGAARLEQPPSAMQGGGDDVPAALRERLRQRIAIEQAALASNGRPALVVPSEALANAPTLDERIAALEREGYTRTSLPDGGIALSAPLAEHSAQARIALAEHTNVREAFAVPAPAAAAFTTRAAELDFVTLPTPDGGVLGLLPSLGREKEEANDE